MPYRSHGRLPRVVEHTPDTFWPDAIDETVIHDPNGRPWMVCTSDLAWRPTPELDTVVLEGSDLVAARFETHVFNTTRAGIRGFPTGYGEHYETRELAVAGHREWSRRVRAGEVTPD